MKDAVSRATRDERGAAYVLTLVLLLVGGLIMGSLLGHMGTGIIAGEVHEKRTAELYASDAGVEEAIRRISNPPTSLDRFELDVNDKHVDVDIDRITCGRYRITSTATTNTTRADNKDTTTTTVVEYWRLNLADNAITSMENVDLGNHVVVEGTIQYGGQFDPKVQATYDQDQVIHETYDSWPDSGDDLYPYYYDEYVEGKEFRNEYADGHEIDDLGTQNDPLIIDSTYVDGDLTIKGSGWVKLNGTIYLDNEGTLTVNPSGQGIHIYLDGHTVFAEGAINFGTGGQGVNLYGSGSLIAVNYINFQPNASSEDGSVLVLSLEGYVNFQPTGGNFRGFIMSVEQHVNFQPQTGFGTVYGSVAGNVNVDVGSAVQIHHVPISDLNIDFPFDLFLHTSVRSWNISTDVQTGD